MKIDFEFDTPHGIFRDALHLQDDHTFGESEIEEMKQERLNNWLSIVNAPPQQVIEEVVVEPPKDMVEINSETYQLLQNVPPSGAKLIEVNGFWYYKV